jgi:hypothetical protein
MKFAIERGAIEQAAVDFLRLCFADRTTDQICAFPLSCQPRPHSDDLGDVPIAASAVAMPRRFSSAAAARKLKHEKNPALGIILGGVS